MPKNTSVKYKDIKKIDIVTSDNPKIIGDSKEKINYNTRSKNKKMSIDIIVYSLVFIMIIAVSLIILYYF